MRTPTLLMLIGAAIPGSASAQWATTIMPSVLGNVVGNMTAASAEEACMMGAPNTEAEIAEARTPATAGITDYFAAAQAGQSRLAAFVATPDASLTVGGRDATAAGIDAAADPLARSGDKLRPEPLRFFRSGHDASALGQWAVQDGQGAVAGVYTGFFVRKSGAWKLRHLTVTPAGEKVVPAVQFCHAPGDVTAYNISSSQAVRERAEKRLVKAKQAAGAAPADPVEAQRLVKTVAERETALTDARKREEEAHEAERKVAALTVDAKDALLLASK